MRNTLFALTLVCVLATAATAATEENFDYDASLTQGSDDIGTSNGGGFSGTVSGGDFAVTGSGNGDYVAGLSFTAGAGGGNAGPAVGGALSTNASSYRQFDHAPVGNPTVDSTFYFSMIVQPTAYDSDDTYVVNFQENNVSGGYNITEIGYHLEDGGTNQWKVLGGAYNSDSGGTVELGKTYFLVGKIVTDGTANTGQVMFKAYEEGDVISLTDDLDTNFTVQTSPRNRTDERASNLLQFTRRSGAATYVDAVRLGDNYSDVVVPEPATMGLMAMGGLALLRRRRR